MPTLDQFPAVTLPLQATDILGLQRGQVTAKTTVGDLQNSTQQQSNTAAIASQGTQISGLSTTVGGLSTTVSGLSTTVAAQATSIVTINGEIVTLTGEITSLQTAIQVLNGGGFGTTLVPSGDVTGVTDQSNMVAAIALIATSGVIPPGGTDALVGGMIKFGISPTHGSTFYFTQSMLLRITTFAKMGGLVLEGSGIQTTKLVFTPTVGQPMFMNRSYLFVRFAKMTIICIDATNSSDFIWQQENSGSTTQDYLYDDVLFENWRSIERLSGTNNNSEHKYNNLSTSICGKIIRVPPNCGCNAAPGTNLAITTLNADVQVGDQGGFLTSVAPLASGTNYYVVAIGGSVSGGTGTFQVSATQGGTPITITGTGTTTFTNSSDQFLNFNFAGITKFWSSTDGMIDMPLGGQIVINHLDASAYAPHSPCTFTGSISGTTLTLGTLITGALNTGMLLECITGGTPILPCTVIGALLSGTGGTGSTWAVSQSQTVASQNFQVVVPLFSLKGTAHSSGVTGLRINHARVEYTNDIGRWLYSEWGNGAIDYAVDESSQVGSRNANNVYTHLSVSNIAGPTLNVHDSRLAGKMGIAYNTNNYQFSDAYEVNRAELLQAANVRGFMVTTPLSNSGGSPVVSFNRINIPAGVNPGVGGGTFKQILDCDWNSSQACGGISKSRWANLIGPGSNLPFNAGTLNWQFALDVMQISYRYFIPASVAGAFNWSIQTNEATPTVLFTIVGSGSAVQSGSGLLSFYMNSDLASKISVVDTVTRTNVAVGCILQLEYNGG